MNKEIFIDKQESAVLKGFAILLIIWGHCHFLNDWGEVYRFHLPIFFILPFFYDRRMELSLDSVKKLILSCIVPYTWFFIICSVVSYIMRNNEHEWWEYFAGYINVPGFAVHQVCGFVFPWFLLCYFVCAIYRLIVDRYRTVVALFIIIGLACCYDYNNIAWNGLFKYDLLMLNKAAYYFCLGWMSVMMYKYVPYCRYIGAVAFVLLISLSCFDIKVAFCLYGLTGFSFFWTLSKWFRNLKILTYLGQNSLYIYLTHVFVINAFEIVLPNTFLNGVAIFVSTTMVSVMLCYGINRMPKLQYWLFGKKAK